MGRAEITRSRAPREVPDLLGCVFRVFFHQDREVEKHLLSLGVRHTVLQPILLRVARVPLEPGDAGEELREKQHRAEV